MNDREYVLKRMANAFLDADSVNNVNANLDVYSNLKNYALGYLQCVRDANIINAVTYNNIMDKRCHHLVKLKMLREYLGLSNDYILTNNCKSIEQMLCKKFEVDTIGEAYIKCLLSDEYTVKDMDIIRVLLNPFLLR